MRTYDSLKRFGRRHLRWLLPIWIRLKRLAFRLRFRSTAARFNEIYRGNHWRNAESTSGFGSSIEATVGARTAIAQTIERYAIGSILDIPCGDFNWMRLVEFGGTYRGADVVPDLVRRNQDLYGGDLRTFTVMDVTRDALPTSDLVLCRDCLNHLSLNEVQAALSNILDSGSQYAALTHFPECATNRDQESSFVYRPLNVVRRPFNWPAPIDIWEDQGDQGKHLAVWFLEDVRRVVTARVDGVGE